MRGRVTLGNMKQDTGGAASQEYRATSTTDNSVISRLREMYRSFPVAKNHRAELKRMDCDITFVRRIDASDFTNGTLRQTFRGTYLCLVRLGGRIEHQFSIYREIPLIYSAHRDLQGRYVKNLDLLFDLIPDERSSIDTSIVLIYVKSVLIQQVDALSTSKHRLVLLPSGEATDEPDSENSPPDTSNILTQITRALYSTDLYAQKTPVTSEQFFGRHDALNELRANVKNGAVSGVFGLRKSGKTSILKQLELTAMDDQCYVYYDLEKSESVRFGRPIPATLLGLARLIQERIRSRGGWVAGIAGYVDAAVQDPASNSLDRFQHMMNNVLKNKKNRAFTTILCLDEVEHLLPFDMDSIEVGESQDEVARFFGVLRALMQENDNFSMILAGITGFAFEKSQIYNRSNPLFELSTPIWLSSLSLSDSSSLLTEIGIRQGMVWDDSATELAWRESGGHPLLLRLVASAVFDSLNPARLDPVEIDRSEVERYTEEFRSNSMSIAAEILSHYFQFYPEDRDVLDLLQSQDYAPSEVERSFPKPIARLVDLGLVIRSASGFEEAPLLRMGQDRKLAQTGALRTVRAEDVLQWAASGESNTVEFKGSLLSDLSGVNRIPEKTLLLEVLRTILGFANAKGGVLLIGVSDGGEVIGLKKDLAKTGGTDQLIRRLNALVSDYVSPGFLSTYCLVQMVQIENSHEYVLVVQVQRSRDPHYLEKELAKGKRGAFYMRNNSQTCQLEGRDLVEYLANRS